MSKHRYFVYSLMLGVLSAALSGGPITAQVTTPKSPFPEVISDKAYAASLAKNARIVNALVAQPSPDHLATAALFARFATDSPNAGTSLQLIERADAMAPARPELVWLHLSICRQTNCDAATALESRLKSLDPDNEWAWEPDLSRAIADGSQPSITEAAARMGARSRLTFYWNALAVMAFDALGVGDPALNAIEKGTTVAGLLAGMTIPPLQALTKPCRLEQLDQPGRRQACETLMARMERSNEFITQSLALHIQQRWWAAGTPQRAQLNAQQRRLDYLMTRANRLRLFRLDHDMRTRIDASRTYEREEDVALALMKSFGEPPEPPAGWHDPRSIG
jgi:hypothetical protein